MQNFLQIIGKFIIREYPTYCFESANQVLDYLIQAALLSNLILINYPLATSHILLLAKNKKALRLNYIKAFSVFNQYLINKNKNGYTPFS
jgi:hypothetical protein